MRNHIIIASALGALIVCAQREASAQAFVPYEHNIDFGANYQFSAADRSHENYSKVQFHIMNVSADYGLPRDFAISVQVPFVVAKMGNPAAGHGPNDDRNYHGDLTDLALNVRRTFLLGESVAVAPTLGVSIPLTDYVVQGNAAPGRGLIVGQLGAHLAWFPGFARGGYLATSYVFAEGQRYDPGNDADGNDLDPDGELRDFAQRTSTAALQVGYPVTEKIGVFAVGQGRYSHDGFHFKDYPEASMAVRTFHDPVLAEHFLMFGAGAAYLVTDALQVGFLASQVVYQENSIDPISVALSLGYSYAVLGND